MKAKTEGPPTATLRGLSRPVDWLREFQGNSTAGEFDSARQAVIGSAESTTPCDTTGALHDPDGQEENGARHQRDCTEQVTDIISVGSQHRSFMKPDVVASQRAWRRQVHESKA